MTDFFPILLLSLFPFLSLLIMAVSLAPAGAVLYLRNEILYAFALPSLGNALIVFFIGIGVSSENRLVVYLLVIVFLLLFTLFLDRQKKQNLSLQKREMTLAMLFVSGHTFAYFFTHFFPKANHHLAYLLRGEILTVTKIDFFILSLLLGGWLFWAVKNRPLIYASIIDEPSLKRQQTERALLAMRAFFVLAITASLVIAGPLAATAVLVLPAFFIEGISIGLNQFMIGTMLFAGISAFFGFLAAIFFDFPPVYLFIILMLGIGLIFSFLSLRTFFNR